MTRTAVIVAATRTPIGRAYKGSLASVRADDLAATAAAAAIESVPGLTLDDVDDLMVGAWHHSAEQGGNIARRVAVLLGADGLPGASINRACASSLQTTRSAFHAIVAGEGTAFLSVGVESISRYAQARAAGTTPDEHKHPAFLDAGQRARPSASWSDPRNVGAIPDVHLAMGLTAENVANLRHVSRADQDAFALRSQQRAADAVASGFFADEITPVLRADGTWVNQDDCPRPGTTAEGLAALPPAFMAGGTVTAGNCCPLSDGAAALVVMDEQAARDRGITPLARIVSTGVSALSPEIMGLGPVEATRRALHYAGMTAADLDLVEINEAFAAQVLPSCQDLGLPLDRVNIHGGAIALGHPYGMGGARLLTTLVHGLRTSGGNVGLATMCAAGGQGMSVIVERMS